MQELSQIVNSLQLDRLVSSGVGVDMLMVIMHSSLCLSDVIQPSSELIRALASAIPDAFNTFTLPTEQLLDCYSLLTELCKADNTETNTDARSTAIIDEDLGLATLVGLTGMETLQKHLSREFVQSGSRRLSSIDTTVEQLWKVLELLDQFKVSWSEEFVEACTIVCNRSTQHVHTNIM